MDPASIRSLQYVPPRVEDSPNRARGNRISGILGRTVYRNDVTSFGDMVDRPMRRIISETARRRISTDQCRAVFSYQEQSDPLPNHQQTATTNQQRAGEDSDSEDDLPDLEVLEQID